MPEFHDLSLVALRKDRLTDHFDEEVSRLLTGGDIPRTAGVKPSEAADRSLHLTSCEGWFHRKLTELSEASGLDALKLLTGSAFTHEHTRITEHEGRVVFREHVGYTDLSDRTQTVLDALAGLELWLPGHWSLTSDILELDEASTIEAHAAAFYSGRPNMDGVGDGEGPDFMFCVLHTVREIMKYARHRQSWVVCHAVLGVSYR